MKIPFDKLDEISRANDIVDVVTSYVRTKKSGKNLMCMCPFHPDKNPSMSISPDKQVYHCFACGASGNVFTFVQNYEKITFVDAAIKLAIRAGIKLNLKGTSPDISNETSKILEINKIASAFFHNNLNNIQDSSDNFVWDYIQKRGIDKETVSNFKLGFSLKSWDALINHFREDNLFTDEDLLKSGLFKTKDGKSLYDTFRGRLMFPIFNEYNKVIGFGARKLFDDDVIDGKYINSQETPVYHKSNVLYGLNFAKEAIRANDSVIIVEGYMDLISLYMNGIHNVVASSGTALTPEQVNLISRYTKDVILIFDSDSAGVKASKAGLQIVLEAGLNLNVVSLPEGQDPDSFIRTKGKDEFENCLNNKKNVVDFITSIYEEENKLNSPEQKTEFIKEIISYLAKIPDKINRSFYVKDLSKKSGIYESDLVDELNKVLKKLNKQSFPKTSLVIPEQKTNSNSKKSIEIPKEERDLIMLLMVDDEDVIWYIENQLEFNFIKTKIVKDIVQQMLEEFMNEGKIDVRRLTIMNESENIKNFLTEIALSKYIPSELDDLDKNSILHYAGKKGVDYMKFAKDLIKKFKINKIEEQIQELRKERKDIQKITLLIQEIKMIKDNNKQQ